MQAADPQPILSPITEAAIFLVVAVDAGGEEVIRELLEDVSGLKRSVGFRLPEASLTCVLLSALAAGAILAGCGSGAAPNSNTRPATLTRARARAARCSAQAQRERSNSHERPPSR